LGRRCSSVMPVPMAACGGAENRCRRLRIAIVCLLGAGLAGCATTGTVELAHLHLRTHTPIKILVVQTPLRIDPARLRAVFAPATNAKSPHAAEAITQGVKHAEDYALAAMKSALKGRDRRVVIVAPAAGATLPGYENHSDSLDPDISQSEADRIEKATGADAILRFGITDYGLTPRSWRDGYIAFEITSTLALTAAIAYSGTTAAKAAAGAYLTQETVEETAEAYAGFWALDVVSRPVRIEAELIWLHPVTTVWKSNDTGLSDTRLSRLFRKIGTNERNRQLEQATDHAVQDLMSGFAGVLGSIERQAPRRNRLARLASVSRNNSGAH
jgi:hypothetical protein